MNQFKRAQVIMLPINKKAKLILKDNKIMSFNRVDESILFHNLYIISDDEIKKDDWVYDSFNKDIYIATEIVLYNQKSLEYNYLSKIIATTDSSLKEIIKNHNDFDSVFDYPQPSQQFITKYIESYNKGEVITDVLVEYETSYLDWKQTDKEKLIDTLKLKIKPKDNTIIIEELKNSWNRDEVKQLMIDSYKMSASNNLNQTIKWIEENL